MMSLAKKQTLRVAGLMSGTSADGVDVAFVDVGRRSVKLLAHDTYAYPPSLRRGVLKLCQPDTARVDDICPLNFALGEVFAEAVIRLSRAAGIEPATIDLIGSHGQTIHHLPRGRRFGRRKVASTLQIGEPSVIAERTGITTVADFRPRDMAAGGQGAPLVPYVDYFLFAHRRRARAVQNVGGIANVTYLPAGCGPGQIVAFDTGPGNMVIDHLVGRITAGRRRYDAGGRLAARGCVCEPLLKELMRHPFFRRRPPKTTGREEFGAAFAEDLWRRGQAMGLADADLMATATTLTSRSIAKAYQRFLPVAPDEVILCGGGAHNQTLVAMLRKKLHPAKVLTTDDFGISADAKEAVSFAVLAAATIRGLPANVPLATGARRPVVLGKIIPGR